MALKIKMNPTRQSDQIEIVTTRVFNFSREVVFEAFENPKHLANWWGPKGFTNTFEVFDFRPSGSWKFMMHGPDGKNYPNESKFIEIVKPEKIVYEHLKPHYHTTMTFKNVSGKTKLTWHTFFDSPTENLKLKNFLMEANEQNFDRLENLLQRTNVQL